MPSSRHTTGFFFVILLAVVGYGLVALPPRVIEGYNAAAERSPAIAYAYLALVSLGGLILLGLLVWMIVRVWGNTRRKSKEDRRRALSPSEMSAAQKTTELGANLSAGHEFAAAERVTPEVRAEIEKSLADLKSKHEAQRLELVAFGTISSGKSSLLNALAGRDVFRSNVVGGTTVARSEIPWPAGDRVVLSDTPGLAEVHGESRATDAAEAAKNADLVLFVVDGPLKDYEHELLEALTAMEKRVLVCLNKADWYDERQQADLVAQIVEQVSPTVAAADVIAVSSRPVMRKRIHVLADGSEEEGTYEEPPNIEPLARRLMHVVKRDGSDLLLANLLLQSRGLVDQSKQRVLATLDERADELVSKYMWAAGGATAINPFPLLDLAGGSAITVKMVLDLAGVYQQSIDADTVVNLLGQLGKNLVAMIGASAAAPALAAGIGSLLKTVPGIGTIAGGMIQGLVQALVTRWIGRVFMAYFRAGMEPPPGGLAELAREKWHEVTRPDELRKMVQAGRSRLTGDGR